MCGAGEEEVAWNLRNPSLVITGEGKSDVAEFPQVICRLSIGLSE